MLVEIKFALIASSIHDYIEIKLLKKYSEYIYII